MMEYDDIALEFKNDFGVDPVCGCYLPPGWKAIVRNLIVDLSKMKGWNPMMVDQIKEKFGGLRFYISNGTDEMDDRIRLAELEAAKTCDECGKPGTMSGNGWRVVQCEEHKGL